MFVSDLRHFLDLPADAPGPARRMADRLASVVRAASAAKAGTPWESALRCQRRPAHRACPGHIAVFRADLPAPIAWRCTACGDDGVISGWEDSHFDLRGPRSEPPEDVQIDVVVSDEVAAALRDLRYLDTDCERVVFRARAGHGGVMLTGGQDEIDELINAVAAEANHETDSRRRKRLDAAFTALNEGAEIDGSDLDDTGSTPTLVLVEGRPEKIVGKWRILEMDLWDQDALDLVGPAYIEFDKNDAGRFGIIAVTGWLDCRHSSIDGHPNVEFSWEGHDDNDRASGRGRAVLHHDGSLRGHIYFHMGDDSSFAAGPWELGPPTTAS
jgi:hypothetical protein